MLGMICAEIRNWFTYDCDKHIGDYEIIGGVITPSFDFKTDYVRIIGSRKNDGVYKVSDITDSEHNPLVDEGEFHGAVWEMSVPKDFIALCDEIAEWQSQYGGAGGIINSPFNSESFGGYSYTKSNGRSSESSNNSTPSWQSIYASRLNVYRKI